MFSNSHYRWKLGAGLAAVALLGVLAAVRGESINPMLWRCVAEPERWNNTRLWFPVAQIVSVRESSFVVMSGDLDATIRVVGAPPGKPGDWVSVTGTFRSDGPRLDLERARLLPPRFYLRWLMEAVSVLVVAAVLANFMRHFLFRPKLLQVEGEPRG